MLTVLTWLWSQPGGRTRFTAGHVNVWAAMIQRHLTLPHRLACVTDMPLGIRPDVTIIPPTGDFTDIAIPTWPEHLPQCHRRLALFAPDAAERFGERIVSMDVDCVASADLDPLFDRSEDLVLYRGTAPERPYNGSMVMLTAGARPQVFTDLTAETIAAAGRRYLGSDQAWLSYTLGDGEAAWDIADGVGWYGPALYPEKMRLVFFPGFPKPWNLIGLDQWVTRHYRGSAGGRCLVLGGGRSLWSDVEAAGGQFGAVIATRAVAPHWPGPLREVVETERDAELAWRAHGFAEAVWCGREVA